MAVPSIGIVFPPALPPEALQPLARELDEIGVDELWVSEDCFAESGVACAVAALGCTTRLRVGLGLLPVPLRNVAQAAMEIATVDRLFPGRFRAGVGHGIQPWMGQAGVRATSPLTLLREYAGALRRLLAGERVSVKGEYVQLDDVQLAYPPPAPTLLVGAGGPKSLAVAGELGDGTLLPLGLSIERIREATETTRAAAGSPSHPVLATLIVATGPDARSRIEAELAAYGMPADPDVGVAGDASTLADAVRALGDLGITTVSLQTPRDETDLAAFARFVHDEVQPLLVD